MHPGHRTSWSWQCINSAHTRLAENFSGSGYPKIQSKLPYKIMYAAYHGTPHVKMFRQTQLFLPETNVDRGTNESKECQHFRQVPWSVSTWTRSAIFSDSKGNQPRRGWNNVEHELTRLSCFVQGSCRFWPHTRAEDAWSKVDVDANEPCMELEAKVMALTSKAPIWWRLPLPSGDSHLSSFHLPPFPTQFFHQALSPNGWRQKSQSQSCLRNEKKKLLGAGNNSWRTRK